MINFATVVSARDTVFGLLSSCIIYLLVTCVYTNYISRAKDEVLKNNRKNLKALKEKYPYFRKNFIFKFYLMGLKGAIKPIYVVMAIIDGLLLFVEISNGIANIILQSLTTSNILKILLVFRVIVLAVRIWLREPRIKLELNQNDPFYVENTEDNKDNCVEQEHSKMVEFLWRVFKIYFWMIEVCKKLNPKRLFKRKNKKDKINSNKKPEEQSAEEVYKTNDNNTE